MRECAFPGCDRQAGRDYCLAHRRQRLAGRPLTPIRSWTASTATDPKRGEPCSIPGCDCKVHARGLCVVHYNRQNRGQSLAPAIKRRPPRASKQIVRDAARRLDAAGRCVSARSICELTGLSDPSVRSAIANFRAVGLWPEYLTLAQERIKSEAAACEAWRSNPKATVEEVKERLKALGRTSISLLALQRARSEARKGTGRVRRHASKSSVARVGNVLR